MILRAADLADTPLMASVHAQAFDRPWDQATFARLLSGTGAHAFVAVDEDPVGVLLCRALAGEAEVMTLAVPPWARRRGIARALMLAGLAAARERDALTMFLEVDVDNAPAVGLYESLGFERAGLRRGYYDRGSAGRADALVMRLDLGSQRR